MRFQPDIDHREQLPDITELTLPPPALAVWECQPKQLVLKKSTGSVGVFLSQKVLDSVEEMTDLCYNIAMNKGGLLWKIPRKNSTSSS